MPGDGGPGGKGKQTGMWSEGKEIGLLSDEENVLIFSLRSTRVCAACPVCAFSSLQNDTFGRARARQPASAPLSALGRLGLLRRLADDRVNGSGDGVRMLGQDLCMRGRDGGK